ncbi:DNA mismatch repair protein MutL [Halictus rubicundus]|uniref:DNA mismatch repair protein MutL n=1 Tax=Halictus rubicundus TaxID=77578 RepID=UPI004036E0EA
MATSIIAASNVTDLPECVQELVMNSLNAESTAIAIRFHAGKRKIQVVDNGVGIPRDGLTATAEYNDRGARFNVEDICNARKQTLASIRRLSDVMMITSRHRDSPRTYMKVFKVCDPPKIFEIRKRPSCGTTVSIYGFHELTLDKWNVPLMYFIVGNIAIVNPHVSFSIRDDQRQRVIMAIAKPHEPIEIFQLLYCKQVSLDNLWHIRNTSESRVKFCAFIGLANTKSNALQYIFLNNRPVHCPLILRMISAAFVGRLRCFARATHHQIPKRKSIFILLFISCREYIFTMENRKRTLILPSVQNLFLAIQNDIMNIFFNNTTPLSNSLANNVRKSNHLIYGCINGRNGAVLFERTPTSRALLPRKNCILRTVCHIVQKETTKIIVQPVRETTIDEQNLLCYSDALNIDDDNGQSKTLCEINHSQMTTSKVIDVQKFTRGSIALTLSEWSNWTYPGNKSNRLDEPKKLDGSMEFYKRFDFLPNKLHKLLRGNTKLTRTNVLREWSGSDLTTKLKSGLHIPDVLLHQEIDVRPCKSSQRLREFKLKADLLKFVKILGQMNNELIVGLAVQDNRKVLLLMDQHAVHERIRYETLLRIYKTQSRNQLLSVKLQEPVIIQLPAEECGLLLKSRKQLKRFGIGFSTTNDNAIVVRTVPECLKKNKYRHDNVRLQLSVRNLLDEMLRNFQNNRSEESIDLPVTIHNAIAAEACHGA